ILDFGLAKLTRPDGAAAAASSSSPTLAHESHTSPGQVLGTVGYMSPEQVRGMATDQRSDIFAFGAIAYEMLSGQRAFRRESGVETMTAILKEEPPELTASNRNVPPGLERMIRHCLEKNPEERFQSARDIAFDLGALSGLSGSTLLAAPAGGLSFAKRKWLMRAGIAGAIVAAAVIGIFTGQSQAPASHPNFQRITFRPGTPNEARFAPDRQTVVYSAAWEGGAPEIYSARLDEVGERPLNLPDAHVLAISSKAEMAILLRNQVVSSHIHSGTLARMPLAGGAPREVLSDIEDADWTPDGSELAVVHVLTNPTRRVQLEYPPGKELYSFSGWVSHPRFSPDGRKIAFLEHPFLNGDDQGWVSVIDVSGGKPRRLTKAQYLSVQGLAWAPSGREVWYTATEKGVSRKLWAVDLAGKERPVASLPGDLLLADIDKDGRVLLACAQERIEIRGHGPSETKERNLGWFDYSLLRDISRDGKQILIEEDGDASGLAYAIYLRRTDGSAAVRLGEGSAFGISPDGKWVLGATVESPAQLFLLPTGAGDRRVLTRDQLVHIAGGWFPDSKHIGYGAIAPGQPVGAYAMDVDSGAVHKLLPDGAFGSALSLDGKSMAGTLNNKQYIWSVDPQQDYVPGKSPEGKPLVGALPDDVPIQWTPDGRSLLLFNSKERVPKSIYTLDLATGRRQLWKTFGPPDTTGIPAMGAPLFSDDLKAYAYLYVRNNGDFYVIDGLK
ncbi:MAG TPA: protein kinase, partial [Terriglobales bacterium]|nr:protein kinase [Terriglobales bacterium]